MYTHLLSSVFDDWVDEFTDDALVDYAVVCRAEALAIGQKRSDGRIGEPASIALGAQIAYDRALIKLCAANGVEVSTEGFSHPDTERTRLEHELATRGVNLSGKARKRGS